MQMKHHPSLRGRAVGIDEPVLKRYHGNKTFDQLRDQRMRETNIPGGCYGFEEGFGIPVCGFGTGPVGRGYTEGPKACDLSICEPSNHTLVAWMMSD